METTQEEVKKIGNYRIEFITKFNHREDDKIFLQVSCSDDFKQLLKKAIIDEKTKFNHSSGHLESGEHIRTELKRYRVKTWVYSGLYSNSKELLFLEKFVNGGVMELGFLSSDVLENTIENLKQNFKRFIEIIGKFTNLKMSIVYELNLN